MQNVITMKYGLPIKIIEKELEREDYVNILLIIVKG